MRNITLTLLLIASTLYASSQSNSKSPSTRDIALDYMKAYGNWDYDAMKEFYAEDIYFKDITGSETFQRNFEFVGKENVYTFFKDIFKNDFKDGKPPYVNFKIEKVFVSGSYAVINSTFECIIPSVWFKSSKTENIFISIPFLTILQIKDGKIISQRDYGDYETYNKQIGVQTTNNF